MPDNASNPALDTGVIASPGRCFDLAREGQTAALAQLLDQSLSPDLTNHKRDTLLILASYHGHHETAAMLLARGADPDRPNDRGQTALAAASFKGAERVILALLEAGAKVDAAGPEGRTALMVAAMFDRTGMSIFCSTMARIPTGSMPRGAAQSTSP